MPTWSFSSRRGSWRRGDELAIPVGARLRDTPLAAELDVEEAEAHRVPVLPFEVVEERPHEVTAKVHALADGLCGGAEVAGQIVDAFHVVDPPVWVEVVMKAGAAFGHIQRQRAVLVA